MCPWGETTHNKGTKQCESALHINMQILIQDLFVCSAVKRAGSDNDRSEQVQNWAIARGCGMQLECNLSTEHALSQHLSTLWWWKFKIMKLELHSTLIFLKILYLFLSLSLSLCVYVSLSLFLPSLYIHRDCNVRQIPRGRPKILLPSPLRQSVTCSVCTRHFVALC